MKRIAGSLCRRRSVPLALGKSHRRTTELLLSFGNLLPSKNVIGENAWICRTSLLDSEMLADPKIDGLEDGYFSALMAGQTKFVFTAMPTAVWHWKSTTKDNWTLSSDSETTRVELARWQERLQSVKLPSYNRVPAPTSRFDASEAETKDLS